jgi:desumoylating isopeptidase 1
MYRGPSPGAFPMPPQQAAAAASPNPQLASSFLQAVASRAAGMDSSFPASSSPSTTSYPPTSNANSTPAGATVASPIQIATNSSSFHSLLRSHRAVVAFFTSATCGPCKFIEPVFEELAHEKTQGTAAGKVAFVKVDMGVGMGSQVAAEYSVRVTPTFIMFLNGKKVRAKKSLLFLSL